MSKNYIKNFVTGYGVGFKTNAKNCEAFEKASKKWRKIGRDLDINNESVILFCGAKNNGKSSLVRYLVNDYVFKCDYDTRETCENDLINDTTSDEFANIKSMDGCEDNNQRSANDTVKYAYYIDYDPGQPEMTTAGVISAHIIRSDRQELSSPTYLNLLEHETIMMSSTCGINMAVNPEMYIRNCRFIYNQVKQHRDANSQKCPIFVNTMGFIRNVGLAMLIDLIKICVPTDLVVLNVETDPLRTIYADLSPEALNNIPASFYYDTNRPLMKTTNALNYKYLVYNLGFSFVVSSSVSTNNRTALQLAYLATIPDALYKPIMQLNSKWLSLKSTSIYCESSYPLKPNIVIELLHHSWVHLARLRPNSVSPVMMQQAASQADQPIEKTSIEQTDEDICNIIDNVGENIMIGCGIVADTDFVRQRLALITPLSQETLDNDVDCLIKPLSIQVAREIIQTTG